MSEPKVLLVGLIALAMLPLLSYFVARPAGSIIPLYALSVPMGDAVSLPVPLPPPFDTLSSFFGAMALASCAAHFLLYPEARVPSLPIVAWLALLAWAFASTFWALQAPDSLSTLAVATPLILLMLVVSVVPWRKSDLNLLRVSIVLSGIIVGLYALFLLGSGQELPTHGEGTRFSVVSNPGETDPNLLAASLLLPFALSLGLALGRPSSYRYARSSRALGTVGSFLCPLVILLTGSRGGLISAAVLLVTCAYFYARIPELRQMVMRMIYIIALLLVLAVYAYQIAEFVSPGMGEKIATFPPVQRITLPQSSGRVQIWATGYLACTEYCDFGAGIGNFSAAYQLFYPYSGESGNIGLTRPAHNTYLQLIVETGAIGLTLLLVALVVEWRSIATRSVLTIGPSLKAAMIALLVAEFFLTAIWFKFFWLLFIVVRAEERAALNDVVAEEPVNRRRTESVPT